MITEENGDEALLYGLFVGFNTEIVVLLLILLQQQHQDGGIYDNLLELDILSISPTASFCAWIRMLAS